MYWLWDDLVEIDIRRGHPGSAGTDALEALFPRCVFGAHVIIITPRIVEDNDASRSDERLCMTKANWSEVVVRPIAEPINHYDVVKSIKCSYIGRTSKFVRRCAGFKQPNINVIDVSGFDRLVRCFEPSSVIFGASDCGTAPREPQA